MPSVPIEEPPANLKEDVLLLPPRKPHDTACKCDVKKLKVSEDTRPEVSTSNSVVGYSSSFVDMKT
jgi:hypothetical protein